MMWKIVDYFDLWPKSCSVKMYLLFSLAFLLQINRQYNPLSIHKYCIYLCSPLFSWMKSVKLRTSVTPTVRWLTAVVKLILKGTSASCPSEFTSQTSLSHTRDQLLMWYARSTRTNGHDSWDSKENGHFCSFILITIPHFMWEQVFAFETGIKDPIW